jgi:hypothetical protein
MKSEFVTYLESIGITKPIQEKIEKVYEFYINICPEEISDIFVTDYIKEDGPREFDSIWFFSNNYIMEAKQFMSKDDFDISPIKGRIVYFSIQKQDYDFEKATEKSRLNLLFGMDTEVKARLKASKENCDFLHNISSKYILPNLKK